MSWCNISCTSPQGPLTDLANATTVCLSSVALETGWLLLHLGTPAMNPLHLMQLCGLIEKPSTSLNALKPHADLQHSDSKEKANPAEKTIVAYCCVRVFAFRVRFCHYWCTS